MRTIAVESLARQRRALTPPPLHSCAIPTSIRPSRPARLCFFSFFSTGERRKGSSMAMQARSREGSVTEPATQPRIRPLSAYLSTTKQVGTGHDSKTRPAGSRMPSRPESARPQLRRVSAAAVAGRGARPSSARPPSASNRPASSRIMHPVPVSLPIVLFKRRDLLQSHQARLQRRQTEAKLVANAASSAASEARAAAAAIRAELFELEAAAAEAVAESEAAAVAVQQLRRELMGEPEGEKQDENDEDASGDQSHKTESVAEGTAADSADSEAKSQRAASSGRSVPDSHTRSRSGSSAHRPHVRSRTGPGARMLVQHGAGSAIAALLSHPDLAEAQNDAKKAEKRAKEAQWQVSSARRRLAMAERERLTSAARSRKISTVVTELQTEAKEVQWQVTERRQLAVEERVRRLREQRATQLAESGVARLVPGRSPGAHRRPVSALPVASRPSHLLAAAAVAGDVTLAAVRSERLRARDVAEKNRRSLSDAMQEWDERRAVAHAETTRRILERRRPMSAVAGGVSYGRSLSAAMTREIRPVGAPDPAHTGRPVRGVSAGRAAATSEASGSEAAEETDPFATGGRRLVPVGVPGSAGQSQGQHRGWVVEEAGRVLRPRPGSGLLLSVREGSARGFGGRRQLRQSEAEAVRTEYEDEIRVVDEEDEAQVDDDGDEDDVLMGLTRTRAGWSGGSRPGARVTGSRARVGSGGGGDVLPLPAHSPPPSATAVATAGRVGGSLTGRAPLAAVPLPSRRPWSATSSSRDVTTATGGRPAGSARRRLVAPMAVPTTRRDSGGYMRFGAAGGPGKRPADVQDAQPSGVGAGRAGRSTSKQVQAAGISGAVSPVASASRGGTGRAPFPGRTETSGGATREADVAHGSRIALAGGFDAGATTLVTGATDSAAAIRAAFAKAGLLDMLPPPKTLARALVLSAEEEAAAWAPDSALRAQVLPAVAGEAGDGGAGAGSDGKRPQSAGVSSSARTGGCVASTAVRRPASAAFRPDAFERLLSSTPGPIKASVYDSRGACLPGSGLDRHPFPQLRDLLGLGTRGKKAKKGGKKKSKAKGRA